MNRKSVPIWGSFSLPIFWQHPVVTSRCLTFGHHKRYQSVTPFLGPRLWASVPPGLGRVCLDCVAISCLSPAPWIGERQSTSNLDRGTTINVESLKTVGGGDSTTGRRDKVEIRRAKGDKGKQKGRGEVRKKTKPRGRG